MIDVELCRLAFSNVSVYAAVQQPPAADLLPLGLISAKSSLASTSLAGLQAAET